MSGKPEKNFQIHMRLQFQDSKGDILASTTQTICEVAKQVLKNHHIQSCDIRNVSVGRMEIKCLSMVQGDSKKMLTFAVHVIRTNSDDEFFIARIIVSRFMGEGGLFQKVANELLNAVIKKFGLKDTVIEPIDEGESSAKAFGKKPKMTGLHVNCPRCSMPIKCFKDRRDDCGPTVDYANVRKHVINNCKKRTENEEKLVTELGIKKGKMKGEKELARCVTMTDIKGVAGLEELLVVCRDKVKEDVDARR